jgi:hypothetical protein
VTTHASVNGHDVPTEMTNTTNELSTPMKRNSYIVGKTEIDKMGKISLRDVTIKFRVFHRSVAQSALSIIAK